MDVDILLEIADDFFVVELNVEELNAEDFVAADVSLTEVKVEGLVAGFDNVRLDEISLFPPLLAR